MKKIILAVFILFSLAACSVGVGASGGSNGGGGGVGGCIAFPLIKKSLLIFLIGLFLILI